MSSFIEDKSRENNTLKCLYLLKDNSQENNRDMPLLTLTKRSSDIGFNHLLINLADSLE